MILLTGGSGELGIEIKKLIPDIYAPTHSEFDITKDLPILDFKPSLIIHGAAYTNVNKAEDDKALCWEANVCGTRRISEIGAPVLYISTDGVFDGTKGNYSETDIPNPPNFYNLTKLLGEQYIKGGLILRCCPKTYPWAHQVACTDRFFSAEYGYQTAQRIVRISNMMLSGVPLPHILHVGVPRRSHYEMAIETRPDTEPIEIDYYKVRRGKDTSLDLTLMNKLCVSQ